MNIYQITYYAAEVHHHDHHNCGHDHDHDESCNHDHEESHHHHHSDLPRKIQSLGSWAHVMPTTLLLQTDLTADNIKSSLEEVVQDNETFFVSEITKNNAALLPTGAISWITTRLK